MIQLSMADANDFIQSAILDGAPYKLHFAWNSRAGQWTLDLRDGQGNELVRGIAVVPNLPLLNQCRRNGLPRGELMAVTTNQDAAGDQTIGRADFVSGKFSMVFIPGGEIDAIRSAVET
jgi:hypothetical protein|nr:MAG TPA: hypothetical protein [Caudoviricetes sp.]